MCIRDSKRHVAWLLPHDVALYINQNYCLVNTLTVTAISPSVLKPRHVSHWAADDQGGVTRAVHSLRIVLAYWNLICRFFRLSTNITLKIDVAPALLGHKCGPLWLSDWTPAAPRSRDPAMPRYSNKKYGKINFFFPKNAALSQCNIISTKMTRKTLFPQKTWHFMIA